MLPCTREISSLETMSTIISGVVVQRPSGVRPNLFWDPRHVLPSDNRLSSLALDLIQLISAPLQARIIISQLQSHVYRDGMVLSPLGRGPAGGKSSNIYISASNESTLVALAVCQTPTRQNVRRVLSACDVSCQGTTGGLTAVCKSPKTPKI